MTTAPAQTDRNTSSRGILLAGAVLAVANALLHFIETPEYYEKTKYIGVLFVLGGLALLLAAYMMLKLRPALGWLLGAVTSLAMLVAGILSRTTGLPSYKEEDYEPALLLAFALEIAFLVVYAVHARRAGQR